MAILHTGLAKVLAGGDQEITPSSNDWDYSFSQDEWKCSGRATGSDDDMDGAVDNDAAGDSGVISLHTFDGDFDIEFTIESFGSSTLTFGVYAIDEDSTRTTGQMLGLNSMTDSFWYNDSGGVSPLDVFYIGGSSDSSTVVLANGDDIKMERRSGTITVYQNGSSLHVFTSTNTSPMRFAIGQANVTDTRYDNFKFTDVEKVQRDGLYDAGTLSGDYFGGGSFAYARYFGQLIRTVRSGKVTSVKFLVQSTPTPTSFSCHCEVWADDGTNPTGSSLGSSSTITLSTTGVQTITFATPVEVNAGTLYWFVLVDEGGSGHCVLEQRAAASGDNVVGSDSNAAITSLVRAGQARHLKLEVVVETTSEPTPDHDTLLLIHSDHADTSSVFTDSSQFGRTVTVGGDAQHATAEKQFGASSIAFDGTGDYLTVPDHVDFDFGLNLWTVDFWYKASNSGRNSLVCLGDWDCANGPVIIFQSSDGDLAVSYNLSSGVISNETTGTTAIDTGAWVHIAVSRTGPTTLKAFVNGTEDTSVGETVGATATMTDLTTVLSIGRMASRTAYDLTGHIEEVRVSRVARWSANFTAPTAPYP